MDNKAFQVRPVRSYEEARYFAAPVEEVEEPVVEEERHPLTLILALVLVAGISVGLIGCYMRTDYHPDPPVIPDGGPDGDPPDCDDGATRCGESGLAICEGGEWAEESCDVVCAETYGDGYSSMGCDAEDAENPCRCQYDIIDGEPDPCYPNDAYCTGDGSIVFCEDDWREVDCDEYCLEQLGDFSYSTGCDASDAEDPCQCEYDLIGGVTVECNPEDIRCVDDWNVERCEDFDFYTQSCDEYCREVFGYDYYPAGACDQEAEDPCQCEYGIIDGEMIECDLGQVTCLDEETLGECVDYWWQPQGCDELCVELYGEGSESGGCDASNADDPCLCESAPSGSGRSGE